MKKPSGPRKTIEARDQEPENTDNCVYSLTKVIKTDDRARPKSIFDGKTLQEILNLRERKYVGLRVAKRDCNFPVAEPRWKETLIRLENHINTTAFSDCKAEEGELHQIAKRLFCRHHEEQVFEVVKVWITVFEISIGTNKSGPVQGGINSSSLEMSQGKDRLDVPRDPTTRNQTKGQNEEISRGKDRLYTYCTPTTRSQTKGQTEEISHDKDTLHPLRGPTTRSQTKVRTKKTAALEPLTRIFKPFPQTRQNLADIIRKVMINNVKVLDTESGLIYIYWIPGNQQIPDGLVKIGTTGVTAESRFAMWANCHPDLVRKYHSDSCAVPHARCVERLIHAELRNFRYRQIGCPHCLKNHVELFAVSIKKAIMVTKKWTEWARGLPYYENGLVRRESIPILAHSQSPRAWQC